VHEGLHTPEQLAILLDRDTVLTTAWEYIATGSQQGEQLP
jgi:hypothetical protein